MAAVSADTEAQTRLMNAASKPSVAMLYGMDIPTMQRLGLLGARLGAKPDIWDHF